MLFQMQKFRSNPTKLKNKSEDIILISRRKFLKNVSAAGAALAFPAIVPSSVFGKFAPSNRITMGCIGVGRMGRTDLKGFLEFPEIQVVAVCDLDKNRLKLTREMVDTHYSEISGGSSVTGCKTYHDFRELLSAPDIDVVQIVTPDHWHAQVAIAAARAGKDIFLEKPMTRTIPEGRLLVEAVNQSGSLLQVGSQQRSDAKFRMACELVRNGRIGNLQTVTVGLPTDPLGNNEPPAPVPEALNYDMWLGWTQWKPYSENRVHPQSGFGRPGWMRVNDYTAGMITNWGAHHMDIALWGMGDLANGPVQMNGYADFPADGLWDVHGDFRLEYVYQSGVRLVCGSGSGFKQGILFQGDQGWIFVRRGFIDAQPKSVLNSKIKGSEVVLYKSNDHKANFIECTRSRNKPVATVEIGHAANTACLTGEIVMKLQRNLIWDQDQEIFTNDEEANRLINRPRRSPWHL